MSLFINLVTLQLQNNKITGLLPLEISMMTNLTVMELGSNNLHGAITEEHFAGLHDLRMIDLSDNQLEIAVGPEWLPPFIRLQEAYLAYCHMGPQFPPWMQRLPDIDKIDISSTGIADQLPYWFSTAFSKVTYLDISNNSISGGLPANMEIMLLKGLRLGCLYLFYKVCVPDTDEPQQGLDTMCLQEEHKCLYLYLLKKGRYYYA